MKTLIGLVATLCVISSSSVALSQVEMGKGEGTNIIPVQGLEDRRAKHQKPPKKTDEDEEARRAEAKNRAVALVLAQAGNPNGWLERGWRWDLNIDLAVGGGAAVEETLFFGRVRAGMTRVWEPAYFTFGATVDVTTERRLVPGLQLEFLDMATSFQAQLGAMVDDRFTPYAMGAIGWQLFALEGQLRFEERAQALVFLKLRLPISWFHHYVSRKRPSGG